ncbi:hypothetical protein [Deinococcus radiophilus]|uniref:Uncharacterized protein n=1 Tax=Deinococcus radiophilus TaxID=32062 RepID=A0A3S0K9C5_9DEIO|nr:hypothetical protein [Deinococcus radiophilus]RTR25554.1 hypothetical protein EJ104_10495 [Deinococcus radiophilus]UFA50500.1 hypothetical protein LMT64_00845 [Deinococcus radiophilus]
MTYSDVPISRDDRAHLDQIFMQVVLDVQAQAQQTQPPQAGGVAAMFHKEQVSEVLQGCAMLIAGWNAGQIDGTGLSRTVRGLRALERPELAERVEKLRDIANR